MIGSNNCGLLPKSQKCFYCRVVVLIGFSSFCRFFCQTAERCTQNRPKRWKGPMLRRLSPSHSLCGTEKREFSISSVQSKINCFETVFKIYRDLGLYTSQKSRETDLERYRITHIDWQNEPMRPESDVPSIIFRADLEVSTARSLRRRFWSNHSLKSIISHTSTHLRFRRTF